MSDPHTLFTWVSTAANSLQVKCTLLTNGQLQIYFTSPILSPAATVYLTSPGAIVPFQWSEYVISLSGGQMSCWQDGAKTLDAATFWTFGDLYSSTGDLIIGYGQDATDPWFGDIDEFAIFDFA